MLNLPDLDIFSNSDNLLIVGAGGGFDLFCGLPIYFALRERGKTVHLANLTFTDIRFLKGGSPLSKTLLGVTADMTTRIPYAPELHLCHWIREKRGEKSPIWCIAKGGAEPLIADYRLLVEQLGIDAILLVDGGVDSLMRGDEAQLGTAVEDALTLFAVSQLPGRIPTSLVCAGLGAEQDISYGHVFENIAELTRTGDFLGSCSLTMQMEEYLAYEEALLYVHEQTKNDPSVINSSIISAVRGYFDDYHMTEKTRGSRLWISPLMPIYWFFNAHAVIERHLLLDCLVGTTTFLDALRSFVLARQQVKLRAAKRIGLER